MNISVNSTLSRSVITHLTVSLALLSLLLYGGQAIHSFTATMMFGVVLVGTYTSVFIAAPVLIYLGVGTGRDALTGGGSDGASDPDAIPERFADSAPEKQAENAPASAAAKTTTKKPRKSKRRR